jgi:lysozyme family protein
MADFTTALARTLAYEGGWDDDPDDPGGETFRGITRRDHPQWPGWQAVDRLRCEYPREFPACLGRDAALQRCVYDLYQATYWNAVHGDGIGDQAVANEVFDTAVNMGIGTAVTFLQRSLNALNVDEAYYPNVAEDGDCGPQTQAALAACIGRGDAGFLVRLLNHLQGSRYVDLMRRNERLERFARGWLRRT